MKNVRRSVRTLGVVLVSLLFFGMSAFAGIDNNLINAVKNGNVNEAKTLIENGADVNARNKYGDTALMYAVASGYIDIVKLLKAHGAKDARDLIKAV